MGGRDSEPGARRPRPKHHEPAVQRLYRDYVRALVQMLRPDYLGLAAETNLIRTIAPRPVYNAVVRMTNDAAADIRRSRPASALPLYVSVQVETAWGKLPQQSSYVGIDQDLRDFSFMNVLALSSYPYLGGFSNPDQIPLDYYTRVRGSRSLPVLVVEGGWPSASYGDVLVVPKCRPATSLASRSSSRTRSDCRVRSRSPIRCWELPQAGSDDTPALRDAGAGRHKATTKARPRDVGQALRATIAAVNVGRRSVILAHCAKENREETAYTARAGAQTLRRERAGEPALRVAAQLDSSRTTRAGTRIVETDVAERFGVTVRQACRIPRMEREGYVVASPSTRRG